MSLTEVVRNTVDNKRIGWGIFIDLQIAFDTVNHRFLLSMCPDLPNASKELTFYLFAVDTNIYYECKDLHNLNKIVKKELKLVKKWLDPSTNYIIFHSSPVNVPPCSDIKIGKKHVKRVNLLSS